MIMIDTLKASKKLLENGFSSQQSEALVNVIAQCDEEPVMKHDVTSLQIDIQELKKVIQEQSKDIQSLMKSIENFQRNRI